MLVERGQQTVIQLADPLDRGWNPLGLGDAQVSYVQAMMLVMVGYTFTGLYQLFGG
jgi:hypothetical protein